MLMHRILLTPDGGAAPAPAAPAPSPAPAATVDLPGGQRSTPNLNDAFANLDKMMGELPADKSHGEQDKVPDKTPNKPAEADPKDGDEPAEKPVEKLAEKAKPEKAATLRQAYEASKAKLAEYEKKLAELEKTKTTDLTPEEKKAYEDKVAAAEKRRNELEEHMKFVDYSKSEEYKKQYEQPFFDTYKEALELVSSLKVTDAATGEVRQAKPEEFDAIMAISDINDRAEKVEELFGTGIKAQQVMAASDKAMAAWKAQENALATYKTKAGEMEKARMEARQKETGEVLKAFKETAAEGITKFPHLFAPTEGDEKGNAALESGFALAKLAFGAIEAAEAAKLPQWVQERMVNGKLPPVEMAKLHAAIVNKAGAFDRQVLKARSLEAKIAELQKHLEGYKGSTPDNGGSGSKPTVPASAMSSIDAAIERMANGR